MEHDHKKTCKNCGGCEVCERCSHCGCCRNCGKYIALPQGYYVVPVFPPCPQPSPWQPFCPPYTFGDFPTSTTIVSGSVTSAVDGTTYFNS